MSAENPEQGFSFTDKRRVDPETGQVRQPQAGSGDTGAAEPSEAQEQAQAAAAGGRLDSDGPEVATGGEPAAETEPAAEQAEAAAQSEGAEQAQGTAQAEAPTASGAETGEGALDPENVSPANDTEAELLDHLKRINAEYAAYRMRSQREQDRAKEAGVASVVEALFPVLDEVRLARENGDVEGPFDTHVTKLFDTLAKLGVTQYGEVGEEFDANIHEALMQQPSDEVETPTVFLVMQPGYMLGERVLRAARVGVQAPAD
ncbi:nucleotide exchange factor GrpE [Brevibacterium luteolum]|uniref:Protein GrpE n=1 Tax=Brevibacterium luteolum TaxID=199591 RepID=A0A849AVC4_9MICO|nr:nucleotide exchange factor GrpE [Brevibacterium luteolum]MBM7530363.1 molecular chaperone GrpE [Brevibacterium luteolum]NNG80011.1 nucleotide exchange factor GrpE [Brevibacterium luteolum]